MTKAREAGSRKDDCVCTDCGCTTIKDCLDPRNLCSHDAKCCSDAVGRGPGELVRASELVDA
jgi:hypothetical protein